jgi:parallel beta-helix repeat protein
MLSLHRHPGSAILIALLCVSGIAILGLRRASRPLPDSQSLPLRALQPPPVPAQEGTVNYFVAPGGSDANDGSHGHPWATIQHAALRAGPGAVVHVAAGSYAGPVATKVSGDARRRVRFVSDVPWAAKVRAGSVDTVWTNFGDYVDIDGFDIAGVDAATCNGIFNYGSYVRIVDNNVHNLAADMKACIYGSGIVNHQNHAGHDDDVIGNVIHDIGDFSHPHQFHHGIYHANLRGYVWNNLIYRCQGWGIHLWHAASEVTIANNTVFNNAYGGILIGDGDDPGGFAAPVIDDYTTVSNNIVYRNGLGAGAEGYGIEEYGNTGPHNQYLENLVYQNGPGDWKLQNGIAPVGSIAGDPQFVNYQPDGSGDYRLRPTSRAISGSLGPIGRLPMSPLGE